MRKFIKVLGSLVMMLSLVAINPTGIKADSDSWVVDTQQPGIVKEDIYEGVRYHYLTAESGNDNNQQSAIFYKDSGWKLEDGAISTDISFMPVFDGDVSRMGINLMYKDRSNFITVAYDKSGWFWEYKSDVGSSWYSGTRIPSPNANDLVDLHIELDKTGKLVATVSLNEEEAVVVADTVIPANVYDVLKVNEDVVIRLSGFNSEYSAIRIKAEDQTNIPEEPEEPEDNRPVIDYYEDYEKTYDFEDGNIDIFDNNLGSLGTELVTEDGNNKVKVTVNKYNAGNLLTFKDIPLLENFEVEMDITPLDVLNRFGVAVRVKDGTTYAYAATEEQTDKYFTEHFGPNKWSSLSTGPEVAVGETNHWKVRVEDQTITLWVDGVKVLNNTMDGMYSEAGEIGFFKGRHIGSFLLDNIVIKKITPVIPTDPETDEGELVTISSDEMDVRLDPKFPRIYDYTLTSSGKHLFGQETKLDTIVINGEEIQPDVTYEAVSANEGLYTVNVKDDANIDATLKIRVSVNGLKLDFVIEEVINHNEAPYTNATIIRTIDIPNHSLIAVDTRENDANLMRSKVSNDTRYSGDLLVPVNSSLDKYNDYAFIGILSNEDLSATLISSSLYSSGGGTNDFTSVHGTAETYLTYTKLGLASAPWDYHRDIKYDDYTIDTPKVSIILTEDRNGDNVTDWQDGAIAYRDIQTTPVGAENVPNLVAYRIAMNFGSMAQNPFLTTLDGIKKINLHTDGLGQSILLKGYGSEGHDSGHLNYADVGTRIGGIDDFNYLMEKAHEYGTEIGIHVNASETYPESKYFSEELLLKSGNGYSYGWNWIDQGINIDASYDLANGRRQRFEDLKAITGDNLDWIYVDVWGNGQSGDNSAWPSKQLAKEIHDQGWRLGAEWSFAFAHDSTFQHWSTDVTYGKYNSKGINSNVARFIMNSQRDSWVADFKKDTGAADYPLLGGYNMKDFEGWQGRNDYGAYINNLFEVNIPTKFVQHFEVNRWVEGSPVTYTNPEAGQGTYSYTPEMEVGLVNDDGDVLTITRKSNDVNSNDFRYRTMTLNGKVVYEGSAYLIPWNYDSDGTELSNEDQKLYYYNTKATPTTWDIPDSWNVSNVVVYELSELGKINEVTIPVIGGQITLNLKANTPYSVYKGTQTNRDVKYGEGAHIVDPGFNTQNLDAWNVEGDGAEVVKSEVNNDMLRIMDNSQITNVSQELTDLEPNTNYVAMAGVDNRSDSKASLILDVDDTSYEAHTYKSIAKNYVKAYAHNTNAGTVNGNSYFQHLYVSFITNAQGEATLTLQKEAGSAAVYFDDVRIVRSDESLWLDDVTYYQDFENNVAGIYPFVVADVEGVEDNRTHLSELNAPYTQRGFNNKKTNDVLDGNWSLKVNGLTEKNKLVYQTIPQNLRFNEETLYDVSFLYEAGSDGTYAFVVGDGESNIVTSDPFTKTIDLDGPQEATYRLIGADDGQSWIGIYSTSTAPGVEGTSGNETNWRGYKDFMLDNLKVVKLIDRSMAQSVVDQVNDLDESLFTEESIALVKEQNDVVEGLLTATPLDLESLYTETELLKDAITNLVSIALDTEEAQAVLAQFDALNESKYTEESYQNAATLAQALREVLEDDTTNQVVLDQAVELLKTALDNLEEKQVPVVDTTVAQELLNTVKTLNKEDYTASSYEKVEQAVRDLEEVLADEMSTQEEIDAKVEALQNAVKDLVNLTLAKELIDLAKTYKEGLYTSESYQAMIEALDALETLLDSDDISKETLGELVSNLEEAIANLTLNDTQAINFSGLQAVLAKADSINRNLYTSKSLENLDKYYQEALALLNQANMSRSILSQETVDKAVKNLEQAINELELKPAIDKPDIVNPGSNNSGNTNNGSDTNSNNGLPTTGQSSYLWISFGLVGLGIILGLIKKRNSKEVD